MRFRRLVDGATAAAGQGVAVEVAPAVGQVRADPSLRRMWTVLGLVLLADCLDVVDATITAIAAPTITADLHGGPGLVKWLAAVYALAMGGLLIVGGRLGDRHGRRRMFVLGMSGFTCASVAAGLAPVPAALVAAKAAQGAFGALMIPQGFAIMAGMFSRRLLIKAFGLYATLLGLVTGAAPVLAGFIIQADLGGLSWRPIFLIDLVLGVLGVLLAVGLLPRDDGDPGVVVDGPGSGLLAAAAFGLLFGLIEGSSGGWTAVPVASLLAGLACFAAFARRQATAADPLLKPSLLRNRSFTSALAVGLAVFASISGLLYVVSLFMQQGLHASVRAAAVAMLPLTLGVLVAAKACAGLLRRMGRNLVLLGLAFVMAGCGWLLVLVTGSGTGLGLRALVPAVFVTGLGMGTCYGTLFSLALGGIAPDEAGSASGSLAALNQLAGGIGAAVVTSIFYAAADDLGTAMTVSLVVVLAVTAASMPVVSLMPRRVLPDGPG
ncbi:MFS transporter [Spirillospora sp. NPDC050679]